MEFANDPVRLVQREGMNIPKGNNTIFFIPRGKSPNGKTVTYGRIVAEIRPNKAEYHHVWLTVGGYILEFDGVT